MDEFLQATVLGLATAAIFAVAASGLVLTYTTTGIFNFAHGALGMLGAFTYWQLRYDWEWPAPVALVVVLGVLAPLVGAAIEYGIMRGLTDAPETVRVVVSISLLIALLGAGLWIWSPTEAHTFPRLWGAENRVELTDSITLTYHDITAFMVAIALAIGLRLLLFRSRVGLSMRAAVDDRPLATLNGARPDRSAMLAWGIGVGCAALSGILIAPITTLNHVTLTLLIVNAYAAAMIGRLRSLPMTFAGAVVLGLLDSYAIKYIPDALEATWWPGWLPDDQQIWNRFRFALPVIVLFIVLLALRQPKPRGHGIVRTRESIPRPSFLGSWWTAAAFVAAGAYLSQVLTDSDALSAARIVALAIIGLSLVPLAGYAGQLCLCQMSFAGIGAVIMAHHGHGGNPLGLVLAVVVTGAVGALVAIPAIRLGGLYFALATAAFAVFLDQWLFVLEPFEFAGTDIKIFPSGSAVVDRVDLPGADTNGGLLVLLAIVFALLYRLVVAVRRSNFGHRLLAMKESPAACATIGMNITATKFAVFTFSAAMAGLGGALYGGTIGTTSPDRFAFITSLPLLLLGVVGGIGSPAGALFAGILLGGMPVVVENWPWFEKLTQVLPGTMGIALGRNPNGAVQDLREAFAPLARMRVALVATLGAVALVLALRWVDVVNGVPFAALLGVAALVGPALARIRSGPGFGHVSAQSQGRNGEVELEWVGLARPYTAEDVENLDRELGLEAVRMR